MTKYTTQYLPFFLLTIVVFLFLAVVAEAQIIPETQDLNKYILEALQNNPELEAWEENVNAAEKQISQAGAWNDPMITLGMRNLPVNSFDFNQEAMTGTWLTLSQSIPITKRYTRQREIAELAWEKSQVNQLNQKFRIASTLSEIWYDWAFFNSTVATLDSSIKVLDEFLQVAKLKYETGKGLQQDLFRIDTEQARLNDMRLTFVQMATTSGSQFTILLGRDPNAIPDSPKFITSSFTKLNYDELDSVVLKNNPSLSVSETQVKIADRNVALKKSMWWPNVNLNAGYGFRQDADNGMSRPDFFSITAGFSIPIFGSAKQGAAVEEAKANSRQLKSFYNNQLLQIRYQLKSLLDKDARFEQQIRIFQDEVIPQAFASVSASQTTYTVGKTDIEALLMAEMTLYRAQLDLLDRYRNRAQVRIKIAAIVGSNELVLGQK